MSERKCSDESRVGTGQDMPKLNGLNAMSNTELLQEIDALLAAGANEMDTVRIEQCLTLLQERAPVTEDCDPASQWDKLKEEHPLLFEDEPNEGMEATEHNTKPRRLGRVLRTAVTAAAIILTVVATANALGFNPIKAVLAWASGIIQVYSGVMELPADDPSEYHSLEEAMEAHGVDPRSCPRWVPKDYALISIDVKQTDELIKYSAVYQSARGELMIRVEQFFDPQWTTTAEKEDGGTVYSHKGIDYYIVSNSDQGKAGW